MIKACQDVESDDVSAAESATLLLTQAGPRIWRLGIPALEKALLRKDLTSGTMKQAEAALEVLRSRKKKILSTIKRKRRP